MKNTNNRETQFWYDPAQYRQLRQRQAHYIEDVIGSGLKAQGKSGVRPSWVRLAIIQGREQTPPS